MGWLRHERRVELGFESQLFNDLKRWGIAKQVLTALGKNFQDFNYLYNAESWLLTARATTIKPDQ